MVEPKKAYKFIFVYNPSANTVLDLYVFNGSDQGVDSCIKRLSKNINVQSEIILGKSIAGNYYQLYLEQYKSGSQYVREDYASVNKYMDLSKIGVAISKYLNHYNLWKLIKD